LFLQQGDDAPAAKPNNFLRHFFVTPLTTLTIPDDDLASSRIRDRFGLVTAIERTTEARLEPIDRRVKISASKRK
jgi:hypothetical protein